MVEQAGYAARSVGPQENPRGDARPRLAPLPKQLQWSPSGWFQTREPRQGLQQKL